ncbi:MAG TPA: phospholipid carrier-dependent glycosyltransferase [Opitutaceae bacterium]|nr:phospholipid carrier-dependent glycosyltransferase [Opitutaceae bacterium]
MALALAFGALFFWRLGSAPLANPDEGRYAEIPREMLASGDWVTPRLDGINYFEKPPLMYWVEAASQAVFGRSEWAVRAPLAIFGLWGVLLTYAAARRLHGRDAGWWSAVVLGTSLLYFALARILLLDLAVSVLMAQALFCFIVGVAEPPGARRRQLFYALYASMALATLTKGLIGFLVTGAVMFLWLAIFNQWRRLRPLYLPTGALLFLALAAPWHILAALRNDTWAHRYFVYEQLERFLTPVASRPGPVWYFVPIVVLGIFPWTGFLWPAVRDAVRGGWRRRNENAPAWFLVVWAAFIFLFFTKSHSKLAPYILPIFPALAVLIGAWLANRVAAADALARLRGGLRTFTFVCGLLAAALLFAVFKVGAIIRDPAQAEALRPTAIVLAVVLLVGGVMAPWLAKVRGARPGLAMMALTLVAFYGVLAGAVGDIQKPGTKNLAAYVAAHARPGDRVMHYYDFFHDFTFYAQRPVELVTGDAQARQHEFGELEIGEDAAAMARGVPLGESALRALWTQPTRLFVVAKKRDVRGQRADGSPALLDDPTFHYRLLAESTDHCLFSNQP